ncbi:MAG: dihydropteroate synthase [Gemmatimonadales bacterium]
MNVTPLALHSPKAVRDALSAGGWEAGQAANAALGAHQLAFRLTDLDQDALEALVHFAGSLGLEVFTGDRWAILAGSRSRLSAFARPWLVPAPLAEAAMKVGMAMSAELPRTWDTARGPVSLDHPIIVAILNTTPDSFSDGGRFLGPDAALAHAAALVEAGADILDVGGESTRPGRQEQVPEAEELARVVPVIEAIVREHPDVPVSVDTVKAGVARPALDAGAAIVNDVSAFRLDPGMAATVAASKAGAILMHSRGPILEISSYRHADYGGDVVGGVIAELRESIDRAGVDGVTPDAIVVDPGFGFSKTEAQSLLLLDQLGALQSLGRPVLVGPSRKRFLGAGIGLDVKERDGVTALACAMAWERGAQLFRVHSVPAVRQALALVQATGGS